MTEVNKNALQNAEWIVKLYRYAQLASTLEDNNKVSTDVLTEHWNTVRQVQDEYDNVDVHKHGKYWMKHNKYILSIYGPEYTYHFNVCSFDRADIITVELCNTKTGGCVREHKAFLHTMTYRIPVSYTDTELAEFIATFPNIDTALVKCSNDINSTEQSL